MARSEALAEELLDEQVLDSAAPETDARHAWVALVHDYLATVGGAERVVVSLIRAFPRAPLFTSLYNPELVSSELASGLDVRASRLNRVGLFRNNYRAAMPALAGTFNRMHVDADVVVCSSSGWAHGASTAVGRSCTATIRLDGSTSRPSSSPGASPTGGWPRPRCGPICSGGIGRRR